MFVTTRMADVAVVTDKRLGAVGVDLNAGHLAVAETDASARVVKHARDIGKPIVIERLDFQQKKAALEGESRRYSRMLSSFSYGKTKAYFLSRTYREG